MADNHFLVTYDQGNDAAQREELRPNHIGFRKGLGAKLIMAGPLLNEAGDADGSMVIIAATDLAAAQALANEDPYVKAGVLIIRSIRRMRIAAIQPPAQG